MKFSTLCRVTSAFIPAFLLAACGGDSHRQAGPDGGAGTYQLHEPEITYSSMPAPNWDTLRVLNDEQLLYLQRRTFIKDPARARDLNVIILSRQNAVIDTTTLRQLQPGYDSVWQTSALKMDQAANGDIAMGIGLENNSPEYVAAREEVASPSPRNDDAYVYYYDTSTGNWSEHVLEENPERAISTQGVYFDVEGRLLVVTQSIDKFGNSSSLKREYHLRSSDGVWSSGMISPVSAPGEDVVSSSQSIGGFLKAWSYTLTDEDSDSASPAAWRDHAYLTSTDIATGTTESFLLTSSLDADIAAVRLVPVSTDELVAGVTYSLGDRYLFEVIRIDPATGTIKSANRSGILPRGFQVTDFDANGKVAAWSLSRVESFRTTHAPNILSHSESSGWSDLIPMDPENTAEEPQTTSDYWSLKTLPSGSFGLTWASCQNDAWRLGLPACRHYFQEYRHGRLGSEPVLLANAPVENVVYSPAVLWTHGNTGPTLLKFAALGEENDVTRARWLWFDLE